MTPQVALLITVLLAACSVPAIGARGGKAAKGAGGGYGGNHGLTNFSAREVTWEDIVLAMELSAMCFGALLALCVVACCAYRICGPADDDLHAHHHHHAHAPFHHAHARVGVGDRIPPEILREIYTLSLAPEMGDRPQKQGGPQSSPLHNGGAPRTTTTTTPSRSRTPPRTTTTTTTATTPSRKGGAPASLGCMGGPMTRPRGMTLPSAGRLADHGRVASSTLDLARASNPGPNRIGRGPPAPQVPAPNLALGGRSLSEPFTSLV